MIFRYFLFGWLFCIFILACQSDKKQQEIQPSFNTPGTHFQLLPPNQSNIHFNNTITEDKSFHHLLWEAVYNGGGIAAGDLNNDGLTDLYFTGNQVSDALYLNKGNLRFEDISKKAGITDHDGWSTGVTLADVNADGLLDIYVCKAGWGLDNENIDKRRNKLFINNGDLTFTEKANEYGLDDPGHGTQASFFDYDRDGDLDLYVMNTPSNNFKQKLLYINNNKIPYDFSDKLFENLGRGHFKDQTKKAGIEQYAFGLGLVTADINQDGWTDIYVACDYEKPDRLFINNKDGTFTDRSNYDFKHMSFSSMGCDVADFNNDLLPDIAVLDMQAADHIRSKINMRAMSTKNFWQNVGKGNGYQYMSNALQLNTGWGFYSEIGQLAGIANTDWSWSILLADFDNDQYKDIFITNGINRDIRNSDLVEEMKNVPPEQRDKMDLLAFAKKFPSEKLPNYLFHNNKDLTFSSRIREWGLHSPGFSYGAAYADLDNDGDLDLIVCNSNAVAQIFKNKNPDNHHWLQLDIKGNKINPFGFGTQAIIYYDDQKQSQELTLTRGYQSAVSPVLHFGLGNITQIDSLVIVFPNQKKRVYLNVEADQRITCKQEDAQQYVHEDTANNNPIFRDVTDNSGISFTHRENRFDDFSREILLPHMQSRNGPHVSVGDVNGDRRDDFFIGGAANQAGRLFLQQSNGHFAPASTQPWEADREMEDAGILLADLDGDNDPDLYVVSGGGEHNNGDLRLQDRLYLNDGTGRFAKADNPPSLANGSCVAAADVDNDGDLDLFVGGGVRSGFYPKGDQSYLLINEKGKFTNQTQQYAPKFQSLGIVTDAVWADYDTDGHPDLVVVSEWGTPTFFHNEEGQLVDVTNQVLQQNRHGWWFHINPTDLDADGDLDFVLGNMGLNNKYHPNEEKPLYVYGNDFDNNNTNDIVLAKKSIHGTVPVRGRECSSEQMPFIAEKFRSFDGFAHATLEDIYGDGLSSAVQFTAKEFRSGALINDGNGRFSFEPFPNEAQIAPVQGSVVYDFNKDGLPDIALAGNHFDAEVETVRHDAGNGLLLIGKKEGGFEAMPQRSARFYVPFNNKGMALVKKYKKGKGLIITANNNGPVRVYEFEK